MWYERAWLDRTKFSFVPSTDYPGMTEVLYDGVFLFAQRGEVRARQRVNDFLN